MGWRIFFFAMHICQWIVIGFLLTQYPFVDETLYADIKSAEDANILNLAVQMGRLDLASLALGTVGLILAASAIFAYFIYGHIVEKTAKSETNEIAPGIISKILRDDPQLWVKVIRDNPELIRSAIRDVQLASTNGQSDISDTAADAIAAASAEDGDDRNGN